MIRKPTVVLETYLMDERSISAKAGNIFRILVIDDDPAGTRLLQEVMKNLQRRHELHFVWDGVEALDFLHCRGAYPDAPRPNLILLDVNMPRLGGLETLSAIKSDPELCAIPVIMLSTSSSASDVRKSYQAHANCYVQKPPNLARFVKLVQAVEAFWMDFVLLPACDDRTPPNRQPSDSKRENSETQAPNTLKAGLARRLLLNRRRRGADRCLPTIRPQEPKHNPASPAVKNTTVSWMSSAGRFGRL